MISKYYCPNCKHQLDVLDGWGTISYYCMECNMLISRKKILTEEEVKEIIEKEKWNYTNSIEYNWRRFNILKYIYFQYNN